MLYSIQQALFRAGQRISDEKRILLYLDMIESNKIVSHASVYTMLDIPKDNYDKLKDILIHKRYVDVNYLGISINGKGRASLNEENKSAFEKNVHIGDVHSVSVHTSGGTSIVSGRDMENTSVNEESKESKELTSLQLDDFPKNKWYRHWGFIVGLIGLLLLLLLWIIDKLL